MRKPKILFYSMLFMLSFFCSLIYLTGCSNGEQFEFELNNNNTYTLTKYNEEYATNTRHIVIPDEYMNIPITSIGFRAFSSSNMVEVTLGRNIEEIIFRAFMDCKKLRIVYFNDQLKNINFSAFANCISLIDISLPESLEQIGNKVFDNCYNLESINVNSDLSNIFNALTPYNYSLIAIHLNSPTPPEIKLNYFKDFNPYLRIYITENYIENYILCQSWQTIINRVFVDKDDNYYYKDTDGIWFESEDRIVLLNAPQSLTEDYFLPDSVQKIAQYAFYKSNLISLTMGDDLEIIEKEAFADSVALNSVIFNDKIRLIEEKAFYSIWGITDISFPSSLEYISDYAFADCVFLKNIHIPSSVQFIARTAFYDTPWLYSQEDEFVIVGDGILIKYNGTSRSITIPESVRVLAWDIDNSIRKSVSSLNLSNVEIIAKETLFFPNLESITFPENLKDIDYNMIEYQPWMIGLEEDFITINDDILIRVQLQNNIIETPDNIRHIMNTKLPSRTKKVILSDSVEIIGRNSFSNSRIEEIVIGDSILEIREDAFARCIFLQSIIILSPTPPKIMDYNVRGIDIYVLEEYIEIYTTFYDKGYNIISLNERPDYQ